MGPANEKDKIPGIDVPVAGGDTVVVGGLKAKVLDVGGHTKGHIALYVFSKKSASGVMFAQHPRDAEQKVSAGTGSQSMTAVLLSNSRLPSHGALAT